ncbi:MAG: superoxide dismutase [Parcubacteria group bacterium]
MEPKPLKFDKDSLKGISKETIETHHDKLYVGYVEKAEEVWSGLGKLRDKLISGEAQGNQTYSELRALKQAETFSVNGMYLHEWYFDVLGGDGDSNKAPELSKAIEEKWGSVKDGIKYMTECAMASRGWAVLAWDPRRGKIMQYNGDSHNQGGVWGAIPVIVLDVYEHAYFMDFGADRKAYIEVFWNNFDWERAEELYLKVREIKL